MTLQERAWWLSNIYRFEKRLLILLHPELSSKIEQEDKIQEADIPESLKEEFSSMTPEEREEIMKLLKADDISLITPIEEISNG